MEVSGQTVRLSMPELGQVLSGKLKIPKIPEAILSSVRVTPPSPQINQPNVTRLEDAPGEGHHLNAEPKSRPTEIKSDVPAWKKFAVPVAIRTAKPLVTIVIDDFGLRPKLSARVIALKGPLTLSFLSYAPDVRAQAKSARSAGHELLLHVPMEPQDPGQDPGPKAMLTQLSPEENLSRLRWALGRFEGYIGINNHMGSRFTRHDLGMTTVMKEARNRGLLYLDSKTVGGTLGKQIAQKFNVPYIARDVFLDNEPTPQEVLVQLKKLEGVARQHGRAVGIAHPRRGTINALEHWLSTLNELGLTLVPLSALFIGSTDSA